MIKTELTISFQNTKTKSKMAARNTISKQTDIQYWAMTSSLNLCTRLTGLDY